MCGKNIKCITSQPSLRVFFCSPLIKSIHTIINNNNFIYIYIRLYCEELKFKVKQILNLWICIQQLNQVCRWNICTCSALSGHLIYGSVHHQTISSVTSTFVNFRCRFKVKPPTWTCFPEAIQSSRLLSTGILSSKSEAAKPLNGKRLRLTRKNY